MKKGLDVDLDAGSSQTVAHIVTLKVQALMNKCRLHLFPSFYVSFF